MLRMMPMTLALKAGESQQVGKSFRLSVFPTTIVRQKTISTVSASKPESVASVNPALSSDGDRMFLTESQKKISSKKAECSFLYAAGSQTAATPTEPGCTLFGARLPTKTISPVCT